MGKSSHKRGSRQSAQRPNAAKHLRTPPKYKGDPEKRAEYQRKKETRRLRKHKSKSKRAAA